jgi:enoyl-CoA hydratase/carnithine racemase
MKKSTPGDPAVRLERQGSIGLIVLSRPRNANTFNPLMRRQLHEIKEEVGRDASISVVLVMGAGRHFSGGADLKVPAAERTAARQRYPRAIDFSMLPQPTVAVINGAAMGGGCELALSCDFRFMATTAQIGLTEIRFGALPIGGGTVRLPGLIGIAAAKKTIMTGDSVGAADALRIGLVDAVEPPSTLLPAAREFAERLAARPGAALRAAKALLNSSPEISLTVEGATGG